MGWENMTTSVVLFVPYYTPKSLARHQELRDCLRHNAQRHMFKRIVLITDDGTLVETDAENSSPIVQVHIKERPTFADWIRLTLQHGSDAELSVLANSDILFPHNFKQQALAELPQSQTALCISRHETERSGTMTLHSMPHWSQDAWCLSLIHI